MLLPLSIMYDIGSMLSKVGVQPGVKISWGGGGTKWQQAKMNLILTGVGNGGRVKPLVGVWALLPCPLAPPLII